MADSVSRAAEAIAREVLRRGGNPLRLLRSSDYARSLAALVKFNPYHDEYGRFSEGPDGGGDTALLDEGPRSRQVLTPEFKHWFGDWEDDPDNASKVVDEDGLPRVVYHGTKSEFTQFDTHRGTVVLDQMLGSHFANEASVASTFTLDRQERPAEGGAVLPVYLNIRNPREVRQPPKRPDWDEPRTDTVAIAGEILDNTLPYDKDLFVRWCSRARHVDDDVAAEIFDRLSRGEGIGRDEYNGFVGHDLDYAEHKLYDSQVAAFVANYDFSLIMLKDEDRVRLVDSYKRRMRALGYDGIKYVNTSNKETHEAEDKTCWIVFEPSQVKSATGNEGSFDPDDPVINRDADGRLKYNPNHDELGRFSSSDSGGGSGGGAATSRYGKAPVEEKQKPRTKSEIAKSCFVLIRRDEQQYCEERNQKSLARKLKSLGALETTGNAAADVILFDEEGAITDLIEVKTLIKAKESKATVHRDAKARKEALAEEHNANLHQIVIDDRDVFNALGPGRHDESRRVYYYRRGVGAYRVENMYRCSGARELKSLLKQSEADLPLGAGSGRGGRPLAVASVMQNFAGSPLVKFNPYHDELGRFSSGSGGDAVQGVSPNISSLDARLALDREDHGQVQREMEDFRKSRPVREAVEKARAALRDAPDRTAALREMSTRYNRQYAALGEASQQSFARYKAAFQRVNEMHRNGAFGPEYDKAVAEYQAHLRVSRELMDQQTALLDERRKETWGLLGKSRGGGRDIDLLSNATDTDYAWRETLHKAQDILNSIAGPDAKDAMRNVTPKLVYGRDGYHPDTGMMELRETCKPQHVAHELGHAIECSAPGALDAAVGFLYHRVGEEDLQDLPTGRGEYGRSDKFGDFWGKGSIEEAYAGKHYANKSGTEVISMGLEALLTDPCRFAEQDPEWFNFTLGVLSGDIPRSMKGAEHGGRKADVGERRGVRVESEGEVVGSESVHSGDTELRGESGGDPGGRGRDAFRVQRAARGARLLRRGDAVDARSFAGWRFFVADYNPDQPRDEYGRWVSHGSIMASPSVDEHLSVDEAVAKLDSEEQRRAVDVFRKIGTIAGLRGTTRTAMGAWADGAENSTVTDYEAGADEATMRACGAMMGLAGKQKNVLAFTTDEGGSGVLLSMAIANRTPRELNKELVERGIAFHTFEQTGEGLTVHVYAGLKDEDTIGRVESFAGANNASTTCRRGRGDFLGDPEWSSRERAAEHYRAELAAFAATSQRARRIVDEFERLLDNGSAADQSGGKDWLSRWIKEQVFNEEEHPRGPDGRFVDGGGGGEQGVLPGVYEEPDEQTKLHWKAGEALEVCDKIMEDAEGEAIDSYETFSDLEPEIQSEIMDSWVDEHISEYAKEPYDEWRDEVYRDVQHDLENDDSFATEFMTTQFDKEGIDWDNLEEIGVKVLAKAGFVEVDITGADDESLDAATFSNGGKTNGNGETVRQVLERIDATKNGYREEFEEAVTDAVADVAEEKMRDEGPPDSVMEAAYQNAQEAFGELSNEEATKLAEDYGALKTTWIVETPDQWQPYSDMYGRDNYEKTRACARYLQTKITEKLMREAGVDVDKNPDYPASVHRALWSEWKGSSTSDYGLLVQYATAKVTGGEQQKWSPEQMQSIENAAEKLGRQYWGGEGNNIERGMKIAEAATYATWATSQYVLARAGEEDVSVYRAVMLKNSMIENETTEEVVVESGDPMARILPDVGNVFTKFTEFTLTKNGAASFTRKADVANNWQGVSTSPKKDATRVVLRAKVPREAVLSLPCYGQNYTHEEELVLAGTYWRKVEAWKDKAPKLEAHPIRRPHGNQLA